jgi:hypothetical protein
MSAMIAPTLPHAADVPWNVERTSVGNDSAATSHVVQLGPNWLKKLDRKYRAFLGALLFVEVLGVVCV